jgi:putative phosphoesterase
MMIGILSDIHGNSFALEAVLLQARKMGIEHLIILGDMVGYYYNAAEVFEMLDPWSNNMIKGNHEEMLFQLLSNQVALEDVRAKYGSGLSIAATTLGESRLSEIKALKSTELLKLDLLTIRIAHATPWGKDDYIYPDAKVEVLEQCENDGVDFVFLGHTHYPLTYVGRRSIVINPGSVGQSRVRGGIADWGILNSTNRVYVAMQTPYHTHPLKQQIKQIDPDITYLTNILERRPSYETI